jgi:hypothetical protein
MGRYLRTVVANLIVESVSAPLRSVFDPSDGFSAGLVCELFSHHLGKAKLATGDGVGKLVLFLDGGPIRHQVTDMLDVLSVTHPFDPSVFVGVDDARRRDTLGALVRAALVEVAAERGWPTGPVDAAHRSCQATDWRWRGRWGTAVTDRDRRRRAWLEFDFTGLAVLVTVCVHDLGAAGHTATPLCRLPATFAALKAHVGGLSWTPQGQLRIAHARGQDWWLIDPDHHTITFGSPRADRGDAHGQFDLGMIYNEGVLVPRDVDRARGWLQKAADQNFTRAHHRLAQLNAERSEPSRTA